MSFVLSIGSINFTEFIPKKYFDFDIAINCESIETFKVNDL